MATVEEIADMNAEFIHGTLTKVEGETLTLQCAQQGPYGVEYVSRQFGTDLTIDETWLGEWLGRDTVAWTVIDNKVIKVSRD